MQLDVVNIGKHYNNQWLFKDISFSIKDGESIAITGRNGSGKSTLIQIIYGLVQANVGKVLVDQNTVDNNQQVFALSSPYLELPLDFTLSEIYQLYFDLNKLKIELNEFLSFSEFTFKQSNLPVKNFSSGMLQRLKTSLCLASNSPILLLDEPLTNMDSHGEEWYKNCLNSIMSDKIVLIASNNPIEYQNTTSKFEIL
ncbi:MAG: ATP-binding cassette domain-containing protein [Bacteroidota bacterium]|nr:ATP-binding cassette domain-containing protein [Bacteroidota bacterium]